MRNTSAVFIVLLWLVLPLSAQSEEEVAIILKDGTSFRGKVTEVGDRYAIKTAQGNLNISKDEVEKIVDSPDSTVDAANKLVEEAKDLYDKAAASSSASRGNDMLADGIKKLEEAKADLAEIRELFTEAKYAFIDDTVLEIDVRIDRFKSAVREDADSSGGSGSGGPPRNPDGGDDVNEPKELEGIESLFKLLESKDKDVRAQAIEDMEDVHEGGHMARMIKYILNERELGIAKDAIKLLSVYKTKSVVRETEKSIVDDMGERYRWRIVRILRHMGEEESCELLVDLLFDDRFDKMKALIVSSMKKFHDESAPILIDRFKKLRDGSDRVLAVRAMGLLSDTQSASLLIRLLGETNGMENHAERALRRLREPATPAIAEGIGMKSPRIKITCFDMLCDYMNVDGDNGATTFKDAQSLFKRWWKRNKDRIEEDNADYWDRADDNGYPVDPDDLR